MKAYAVLVLLGLAQTAEMCVYETKQYKSTDCSGAISSSKVEIYSEMGKCDVSPDKKSWVKVTGCTDAGVSVAWYGDAKCSGKPVLTIPFKTDTCSKSSDGKTSSKLMKGGVITTVAWGSVVIAMIAAQF